MKKILSSRIIILFAVIGFFVTGCQWNSTDTDTLIRSKDGIYHINGSPKLLELKMENGGIVFSRKNAFSIGASCEEKDFFWSDDGKDFHLSYNGILCFDFNRDFVFDYFYQNGQHFILLDHRRLKVNKPDFKRMQAVDSKGKQYQWNGNNWIIQP